MPEITRERLKEALGPLEPYRNALLASTEPEGTYKQAILNIMIRMAEIECRSVTKSHYRDLVGGEQDEPPTGDTYNEMWDAILDEIRALVRI